MTHAASLLTNLGPGLRRIVDYALWFAAGHVRRMLRALSGNEPVDLTLARRLARRLSLIVRFALIILAATIEPPPYRSRVRTSGAARPQHPTSAGFRLGRGWRRWRRDDAEPRAQPEAFANARRNPGAELRRRFESLSVALSNLAPLARRLAGRLRREIIVPGWRPPKRKPPPAEREAHEELTGLFAETADYLREARRRWAAA